MKIKIFTLRFKCYYFKTNLVVNKQCKYDVHVTNVYIHVKFERVALDIYRDIHHFVNIVYYFFSCGPKSYFSLFCNLIGYTSGPYEAVRTARVSNPQCY